MASAVSFSQNVFQRPIKGFRINFPSSPLTVWTLFCSFAKRCEFQINRQHSPCPMIRHDLRRRKITRRRFRSPVGSPAENTMIPSICFIAWYDLTIAVDDLLPQFGKTKQSGLVVKESCSRCKSAGLHRYGQAKRIRARGNVIEGKR